MKKTDPVKRSKRRLNGTADSASPKSAGTAKAGRGRSAPSARPEAKKPVSNAELAANGKRFAVGPDDGARVKRCGACKREKPLCAFRVSEYLLDNGMAGTVATCVDCEARYGSGPFKGMAKAAREAWREQHNGRLAACVTKIWARRS